jgi:hypothetical protein
VQGFLCDGVLGWRTYVVWGCKSWVKVAITAALCIDTGQRDPIAYMDQLNNACGAALGIAAVVSRWTHSWSAETPQMQVAYLTLYQVVFFVMNSAMTGSIVLRIWCASLRTGRHWTDIDR